MYLMVNIFFILKLLNELIFHIQYDFFITLSFLLNFDFLKNILLLVNKIMN